MLTFELEDGSKVSLRGPWHSNANALFADIGYDVRDKHLTFVVVAQNREMAGRQIVMKDVIYKDEKAKIGLFKRGKILAQRLAREHKEKVCCYSESQGGSSNEYIEPNSCLECGAELIEYIGSYGEDTFDAVKCPSGCDLRPYYGGD